MAEEEKEGKPRRRRRRAKEEPDATPAPEAARESEEEAERDVETPSADEIEPTPADEDAEEAAADVMLEAEAEAEAEIDEDSEPAAEAQAPKRGRRGRRAAAEPKAAESKTPRRPAPARRRAAKRDPNLPPPVVRAQAKYVRSSARKARLVCDHIRGKSVQDARAILAHTPRAVARDWSKLLESAVANAENNHELVGDDLYVKAVHADEGPTIKRFRPRAMGRATRIRKRTAHLTILLTPKE
jgi:ribosomal protein L22